MEYNKLDSCAVAKYLMGLAFFVCFVLAPFFTVKTDALHSA